MYHAAERRNSLSAAFERERNAEGVTDTKVHAEREYASQHGHSADTAPAELAGQAACEFPGRKYAAREDAGWDNARVAELSRHFGRREDIGNDRIRGRTVELGLGAECQPVAKHRRSDILDIVGRWKIASSDRGESLGTQQ